MVELIDPNRYYSIKEVADAPGPGGAPGLIGLKRDTVIRLIKRGKLEAVVVPATSSKRKRVYLTRRILGAELIRFLQRNSRAA